MRYVTIGSRFLILLLAFCMILTAFSGCSSKEEPKDAQSGQESTASKEEGSVGATGGSTSSSEVNSDDPAVDGSDLGSAGGEDDPEGTGEPTEEGSVDISLGSDEDDDELDPDLYDEEGYLLDQLPDDLDFGDEELTVLCWASAANEFGCDETNGTAINDALVRRDINVEERLGVSLKYLTDQIFAGSVTEVSHYVELVRAASQSGTLYDMMALYGRTAAILSYSGFLQNILNINDSYLNFENPWWTQNLLDELVVGKSLYLLSGDITPSIYEQPYTLFYNVDMVKAYQVKDPYEHVKENTWTMENFRLTIKDVTSDQNGGVGYGFVSSRSTLPSLVHGCGMRLMEMDEDQIPRLSDDLFSEKTIGLVDDLQEWFKEDFFSVTKTAADARKVFVAGSSMFLGDRIIECFNFVESCDFAYSVVPTPKYTSEQERYHTTLDTQLTFFCLMKGFSQDDLTIRSAVLECMASEGYRLTAPAVLETCLMSRFAQTEEMSEMLELIIDSVYYDFGRIYSSSDNEYLCDRIGIIVYSGTGSWSGYKESHKTFLENQFQLIIDKFIEMENQ